MMDNTGMMGPPDDSGDAASLIREAIELHKAHMGADMPPTPESQEELLELLTRALTSLGEEPDMDRAIFFPVKVTGLRAEITDEVFGDPVITRKSNQERY